MQRVWQLQVVNPPPLPATRRNWWSRNWFWFVPTGCLGLLAVFALVVLLFFGAVFGTVFGALKSSEPYKHAVQTAKADARVADALGRPVQEGSFPSGSVNTNNGVGSADLSVSISGPKNSGTLHVVAAKGNGPWTYSEIQVQVNGQSDAIDLLASP